MVHTEPAFPAKSGAKTGDPRRQRSLEDIMGIVRRSPNLKEHRRRTILSALRTVGRALGKEPADILAGPATLQKELTSANYLQARISKRRWHNVRSLTIEALREAGCDIMASRWKKSQYTPAWKKLRQDCGQPRFIIPLSRFMNFCSVQGIEPDQVDAAVFEAFRTALQSGSLVRNAQTLHGRVCRLWDRAGAVVPTWPDYRTKITPPSRGYSLAWSTFPASLHVDAEAFLTKKSERDIFSDDEARPVSEATTVGRRKLLRQMATALAAYGVPVSEITSLAVLVQPANADIILRFFLERANGKVKCALHHYACLLRTIARYWVRNVPYDILDKRCRKIAKELKKHRGMKQKNRVRLHQFENPFNEAALLALPAKLMKLARERDTGTPACTSLAVYAVAIELLIMQPIRLKNLANLQLDRNVIVSKDPLYPRVSLTIDGEDVKNGVGVERELSPSTSAMIMEYLKTYRPRISEVRTPWLFPSPRGGARRSQTGFSAQISTIVMRHTGIDINSHLFRGLAVKIIERECPGAIAVAQRLLGHRHIETTLNSYSEGKTASAQKQYENLIEGLRTQEKPFARGIAR